MAVQLIFCQVVVRYATDDSLSVASLAPGESFSAGITSSGFEEPSFLTGNDMARVTSEAVRESASAGETVVAFKEEALPGRAVAFAADQDEVISAA